jgi:hypothetical protein
MGRIFRSAILHIGTEKTGTTSIQKMLAARRTDLAELGFWYPSSPGEESHFGLAVYAAPETALELNGGPFEEAAFVAALTDEMAGLPDHVRTVIFSSEHCHSRLAGAGQVGKLHALLARFFERITVVVYLRRQDVLACSSYSTMLKDGFSGRDMFPELPGPLTANNVFDRGLFSYFDFESLLDRYALSFGKDMIRPRIFEAGALSGDDVLRDFLAACGLPSRLADGVAKANCAIPADGQELLVLLNAYLARNGQAADGGVAAKLRDVCASVAQTQIAGRPRLPSQAEARRFYGNFLEVNERVRAAWFPERDRLFNEDFDQYKESPAADRTKSPHERALNAAFACLAELVGQKDALAGERDDALNANHRLRHERDQLARATLALISERDDFMRQLDAALEGFRTSTSWRMTAPFRVMSEMVRGLAKYVGGSAAAGEIESSRATASSR